MFEVNNGEIFMLFAFARSWHHQYYLAENIDNVNHCIFCPLLSRAVHMIMPEPCMGLRNTPVFILFFNFLYLAYDCYIYIYIIYDIIQASNEHQFSTNLVDMVVRSNFNATLYLYANLICGTYIISLSICWTKTIEGSKKRPGSVTFCVIVHWTSR